MANLRTPALAALLPLSVPETKYQQANASMNLAVSVSSLASFSVAGLVTGLLGVPAALLTGVALLALAALSLLAFREPPSAPSQNAAQPATRSFREGLGYVMASPLLLSLVGVAMLLNLIMTPLAVLLAPYAKALALGAAHYGLLNAANVAGELLGFGLLNFVRLRAPIPALFLGTCVMASAAFGLGLAPNLALAMASLALFGATAASMNTLLFSLAQSAIPAAMMGRVLGVVQAMAMGLQPLGYALTGLLLQVMSVRQIFVGMALLLALASFAWLRRPVREGVQPEAPRLELGRS
ncbi:MFS transporter [Deinococcus multiflagellatus]|uniref:MFS transporter n=1 Tax=Deinococcus multiflagellatus TaxID=1656887 RepID=A0ABW1ZI66_9DEIO